MDSPANPSADKFGPPPGQERFEPPRPRRSPLWFAFALAVAFYVGKYELEHVHTNGWTTGLVLLGICGIALADFLMKRRGREERNGADHYTPPRFD